ncbi:TPA: hypothetical protein RI707_000751 [Vibrio cholerae]|uniref:hypothetical protein n=1 Tax=Vibrio cholerae TaxID=666 RepID=UPI0002B9ED04|nr:hypothetical protein [Vibrio cholerae]USN27257.1 hypothetical protein [synthetic construct]EGR4149269.1 hypothetical protein [Vibrio cholerae]EGR4192981.1 hypothetical protein [Vibrio cholerae]KAA1202996.1 hypothetical protein F0M12_00300 [Vibrio cholerae]MVB38021.1 hypothetical protein [Vibrio cholerae]
MNRKVPLNQWLYKALIDKEMDGFTVLELRNRLLYATVGVFNKNELRKMLYRQLYQLAERGYLEKRNNQANEKSRYFKTSAFKSVEFISAHRTNLPSAKTGLANSIQQPFIRYISQEKAQSEAELRILLGEVEEYKRVLTHFPAQSALIKPLYDKSKEYSAELLGRVNALSKLGSL